MTDFAYTGKKGTGKSKNFIRVARETLREGKTVCSNLDIYLEPMFGAQSRKTYIRVPDKPTAFDLLAAGHGNPGSYDEDKQGLMGLDELGTWFNTRDFSDKGRSATLDFLAHGRKFGWDIIYLMQDVAQVDKQLRESFVEFAVRHTRFDKVKIPFIGGLLCALFGKKAGYFPRFHTASTRLGTNPQGLKTDFVTFVGKDLEACYDTRQVFKADYPHGTHSVLSPWHVKGRYLPEAQPSSFALFLAFWKGSPRHVYRPGPVTLVPEGWLRVQALARRLPPDERLAVMARYSRLVAMSVRPGGA